jgi:hypothetical protein
VPFRVAAVVGRDRFEPQQVPEEGPVGVRACRAKQAGDP